MNESTEKDPPRMRCSSPAGSLDGLLSNNVKGNLIFFPLLGLGEHG